MRPVYHHLLSNIVQVADAVAKYASAGSAGAQQSLVRTGDRRRGTSLFLCCIFPVWVFVCAGRGALCAEATSDDGWAYILGVQQCA